MSCEILRRADRLRALDPSVTPLFQPKISIRILEKTVQKSFRFTVLDCVAVKLRQYAFPYAGKNLPIKNHIILNGILNVSLECKFCII